MARIGALLSFGAAIWLTPLPASAHTDLVRANPAVNSTVKSAPEKVALTFAENLQPNGFGLIVTGPDGARADSGTATVQGATLSKQLTALTSAGRYQVTYRIVGPDGHQVTGSYAFRLTTAAAAGRDSATIAATAAATATATATATSAAAAATDDAQPSSSGLQWIPIVLLGALGVGTGIAVGAARSRRPSP